MAPVSNRGRWLLRCMVGAGLLLPTLGTSCGKVRSIAYRFGMAPCPDSTFALPVEAHRDTYRMTSKIRGVYRAPRGAQYTKYELTEPIAKANAPASYFAVRLSRAESCSIDLAWTRFIRDTANDRLLELATQHDAEQAVLTLLTDSPVHPVVPAFQIDTLRSLNEWGR